MPYFEYKGKDNRGGPSEGILEATSLAEAQQNLISQGIKTVMLRPGTKPKPNMASKSGMSVKPGLELKSSPVKSSATREMPPEPGQSSSKVAPKQAKGARFRRFLEERGRVVILGAALVGLGIFIPVSIYRHYSNRPWGVIKLDKGAIPRTLSFRGRVTCAVAKKTADPWSGVQFDVFLPELESEVVVPRSSMSLNVGGEFNVTVPYLSAAAAQSISVVVTRPGYRTQTLANLTLADDASVELPPVTLLAQNARKTEKKSVKK